MAYPPQLAGRGPAATARPARRPRVLVLLGIDGAGKTTAARTLVAAERAAGRRATVVRNRSGRRWMTRTAHRLGRDLPPAWADPVETVVRTLNVLAAHARAGVGGGLVVMDRHVACQLVLRVVRGLPPGRLLPWLSDRLLRGAAVVVLDLPAEAAHARILARGEDEESLGFLRASRAAYLELAERRGWAVVDAGGTPRSVGARLRRVAEAGAR